MASLLRGQVPRAGRGRGVAEPWFLTGADVDPSSDLGTDRADWVTRRFFALCEDPRTRARMLDAVRSGGRDTVAGRVLLGTVARLLEASLGRSRRVDGSAVTAELVAAQLAGIAVLRYVTCTEPLASMPVEDLVARVAPAVRATLRAPDD